MEDNNQTFPPLLLRMSTDPKWREKPPSLLSRLSTPPLKEQKSESSNELNEKWKSSEREDVLASKHQHASRASLRSGKEHQKGKRGKHMTLTSLKSTPSLLSRMRVNQLSEEPPSLWKRLSSPSNNHQRNESETKLRNSWARSLKEKKTKKRVSDESYEREPRKKTCLGTTPRLDLLEEAAVSKRAESCSNSAKICQESNHSSESLTISLRESPPPSGTAFSEVNQSISTKSSPPCTLSNLMRRERDAWDELRSYLPWQSQSGRSKREVNGLQPSGGCRKQLFSSSLTEERSYPTTQNISKAFSQQSTLTRTPKLSYMINQSAIGSEEARTSYSPTIKASAALAKRYCTQTELSIKAVEREHLEVGEGQTKEDLQRKTSVEDLTVRMDVDSLKTNVIIGTRVKGVEKEDMGKHPAQRKSISVVTDGMRLRYLCYNIWDPASDFSPNTADWTLTAKPLEEPPQSVMDDEVLTKTLREHPHLFKIVTPIRVDIFESYLSSHPNQPFVKSVCKGLRERFWPWADGRDV